MSLVTLLYNERAGSFEAKKAAKELQEKYPKQINTISIREIKDDQEACDDLLSSDRNLLVMAGDGTFHWVATQIARQNQLDRKAKLALVHFGGVGVGSRITTGPTPVLSSPQRHLERIVKHLIDDDGFFQETRLPIRKIVANSEISHPFFWGAFLGQDGVSNWALGKIEYYRNSIPTYQRRFLQSVKDAFTEGLPKPTNLIHVGFNNQCKEVVEAVTLSPDIPYWAQFKFNSTSNETGLLILNPSNKPNTIRILNMLTDILWMQCQLQFKQQPKSLTGTYEYHTLRTILQAQAFRPQKNLVLDSEPTSIQNWKDVYHDPYRDYGYIKILRRVRESC
jgi:hypothetical protein